MQGLVDVQFWSSFKQVVFLFCNESKMSLLEPATISSLPNISLFSTDNDFINDNSVCGENPEVILKIVRINMFW